MFALSHFNCDNNAKDWLLKQLTVEQFIQLVEYDSEEKIRANKNSQPPAKIVKGIRELKELSKRLNNGKAL
jgi:hypothetical protein